MGLIQSVEVLNRTKRLTLPYGRQNSFLTDCLSTRILTFSPVFVLKLKHSSFCVLSQEAFGKSYNPEIFNLLTHPAESVLLYSL